MSTEKLILKNLVHNDSYARKVLPFIKEEYFHDVSEKHVFKQIFKFIGDYNALPSHEALEIDLENSSLQQNIFDAAKRCILELKDPPKKVSEQWLIDETEKFCKDRALVNAIQESILINSGESKFSKEQLPDILRDALSVSFDTNIGHDFLEDSNDRYEFYHKKEDKIPFDIELLNRITRGGVSRKSLNVIMGGVGVGKTLVMTHMAAANLMAGKNVLYITMEMAEEKIAQRIDANLLNTMIEDLEQLPKDAYDKKVEKIRKRTVGKLIIKEFPTASAHVGHFRHLLNELNLKKNFVPDIIYIDYLNICSSSRFKIGSNINSYTYIKSIAEELRGLAIEKVVPIITATQFNREGYDNTDPGLTNTSESFGLPATADLMLGVVTSDELQELNQYMFKQLKNRYADVSVCRKFLIGVDRSRMKLYDVENSAQEDLHDGPVMDKSSFGERQKEDDTMKWATKTRGRKNFSGLKV